MLDNITIRPAGAADAAAVYDIYRQVIEHDTQNHAYTRWQLGVYPTPQTVAEALAAQDLYVLEIGGQIAAAARINQEQVPIYAQCPWQYPAAPEEVLVIHTLAVSPAYAGRGLGRRFIAFYESQARATGCPVLRLDTSQTNLPARSLYKSLGFREAAVLECNFNGLPGVQLVCLEKRL